MICVAIFGMEIEQVLDNLPCGAFCSWCFEETDWVCVFWVGCIGVVLKSHLFSCCPDSAQVQLGWALYVRMQGMCQQNHDVHVV